jgi:polyhydroxyalkanoate synthesis regulator phasin
MKHKDLITRKISDLVNMLNVHSSAISRRESIDYLHNQVDVLKNKIEEIQILINNEESLFNY